jgi:hypothetical protein
MMIRSGRVRTVVLLALVCGLFLPAAGCGYVKNLRDDFLDCGTMAVGIVTPIAPSEEGPKAMGFLPPAIGVYVEATSLFHLGALYKATGDLEWDRRGYGVMGDYRRKFGFGPIHDVCIWQHPYAANAYKTPDSMMEPWQEHMDGLRDPLFKSSAKTMIFKPEKFDLYGLDEASEWESLPWLYRGWQDWEMISVEVAIPEPFILHSGFYFRVGVDPSQFFDLFLGIFGIDLYHDAAFNFNGSLKHTR